MSEIHYTKREVISDVAQHTIGLYRGTPSESNITIAGHRYRVPFVPGTVVIFPAGASHWEWSANTLCKDLCLNFSPLLLKPFAGLSGNMPPELIPRFLPNDTQVERLLLALRDDAAHDCPSGRLFGDSLITALLSHVVAQYAVPTNRNTYRVPAPLSPHDVARITDFIEAHLSSNLSLDTIAHVAGYSPYHLHRRFQAATGSPLHRYVMLRRVQRARALLEAGSCTVAEAAACTGFTDGSHLARCCRRFFGVSAAAFLPQKRKTVPNIGQDGTRQ